MDNEYAKERFKNHVAKFTDYGNIKILDFANPNSSDYRIRFMFEEDYYRLHITGDLGDLIASNYCNMCYDKFSDFIHDVDYFEGKVDAHSRPFYYYDEDLAREQLKQYIADNDLGPLICDNYEYWYVRDEDVVTENFINNVMCDFDYNSGIGVKGYNTLTDYVTDAWEIKDYFGKKSTGIIDLYMLAFKLAQENLEMKRKDALEWHDIDFG